MRLTRHLLAAVVITASLAFPLGVLANHTFTDVPTSNTFHADIDALATSGVTTGCAAGKYCPKDFVTREQMAAFLNRLGALGPGKTPVVNAATAVDLPDLEFENLTLVNGWNEYSPLTHAPAAALDAMGVVHLRGAMETTENIAIAFVLEAKFRPAKKVYVGVDLINGKPGRLIIEPDGTAYVQSANLFADAQGFTSLEGVTYSVAP